MTAPWWHPDQLARRRANLAVRTRVLAAIRGFFAARDFVEVETPALQVSPGLEPHLHAMAVTVRDPDGERRPRFLHTSPEFAMKKLLTAGETRIFQLAPVFRDAERSATHHPEFTMLAWYRARSDYRALMDDCRGVLADSPTGMAALARPSPRDPRVAERFELYVAGLELANAFSELPDPVQQRRRFEADIATKQRLYGERYPIDEDFLAALGAGFPD